MSFRLLSVRRKRTLHPSNGTFYYNRQTAENNKSRQKALLPRPSDGYRVQNKNASIVSILTFLYGGGGGNRTPVRKPIHTVFSGRRRRFNFPISAGRRRPAVRVASLIHDRRQSLRRFTFTAVSRRIPDRSPSGYDGHRLGGDC